MGSEKIREETASRFEQLLTLNHRAFAGCQFEVAYHVLWAAMLSAVELRDPAGLEFIETLADEQGHWIDEHAAQHFLSTASTTKRGHRAFYHTLARLCHQRCNLLRRELAHYL